MKDSLCCFHIWMLYFSDVKCNFGGHGKSPVHRNSGIIFTFFDSLGLKGLKWWSGKKILFYSGLGVWGISHHPFSLMNRLGQPYFQILDAVLPKDPFVLRSFEHHIRCRCAMWQHRISMWHCSFYFPRPLGTFGFKSRELVNPGPGGVW